MTGNVGAVAWTVERPKIVGYLLNPAHADGASKAKYLVAFGCTADFAERLADDLVNMPSATRLGAGYCPRSTAPDLRRLHHGTGRAARLAARRLGGKRPAQLRFLTAYPWKI